MHMIEENIVPVNYVAHDCGFLLHCAYLFLSCLRVTNSGLTLDVIVLKIEVHLHVSVKI